jgi:quinol monooxygenase YgiN
MNEAVVVTIHPPPETHSDFAKQAGAMTRETRSHPGCLAAHLCDAPERGEIVIFQLWTDSQAQIDYLSWRAEKGDFDKLSELLEIEPDFRTYRCE